MILMGTVRMYLYEYERPSLQRQQEVSKVLVQGSFDKENAPKSGNDPVRPLPIKPVFQCFWFNIFLY